MSQATVDPTTGETASGPQAESQAPPRKKRGGGARSEEGKRASRANSLKESLRSKVVFTPEMAAAIVDRTRIFTEQYRPRNDFERMIIANMAIEKAQLDHANEILIRDYDRCLERALNWWDVDHEERAIQVSKRLEKDCRKTVHTLEWTKKGAELLISYWEGLGEAVESNGDWDQEQRLLAYNLLKVRPELRSGSKQVPESGDTAGLKALVERQVNTLRARIDKTLSAKHTAEQGEAISGFFYEEDAVTRKYRRYAAGHRSAFNRYLGMLESGRAGAEEAGTKETGLFPPYPPKTSEAAFDFLYHRYKVIAEAEIARIKSSQCQEYGDDYDESEGETEADPGPADAQPGRAAAPDAPAGKTKATGQPVNSDPKPEAEPTPSSTADPPPRPTSRRARKERQRRLRAQAKAAKRTAQKARSGR
jgi:hypothetical protein